MKTEEIELWAFYYNLMTEESASYIESYHRTEKGAIAAMYIHKNKCLEEWKECYPTKEDEPFEFGTFEDWFVKEFTLVIEE